MKKLEIVLSALLSAHLGCSVVTGKVPLRHSEIQDIKIEEELSPEEIRGIEQIVDMKNLTTKYLGLYHHNNYTTYSTKKGQSYTILLATPKDQLYEDGYSQVFPVGNGNHEINCKMSKMYKSYSDDFEDEISKYQNKCDLCKRDVINFYTKNGVAITPRFLKKPSWDQLRTIIHEGFHATLDKMHARNPNSMINESAAEVFARRGILELSTKVQKQYILTQDQARNLLESWVANSNMTNTAYEDLANIYRQDVTLEEKVKMRDYLEEFYMNELLDEKQKEIFQKYYDGELNNSCLGFKRPYLKYTKLMLDVYNKAGDGKKFLSIMHKCPVEDEEKSIKFLNNYLRR